MKIRDFIQRGRELYVQCHGRHPGIISAPRRVPLELSQFDPDLDVEDLKGRLRCSVRGTTDPRKILADLTKSLEINLRCGRVPSTKRGTAIVQVVTAERCLHFRQPPPKNAKCQKTRVGISGWKKSGDFKLEGFLCQRQCAKLKASIPSPHQHHLRRSAPKKQRRTKSRCGKRTASSSCP